MIDKYSEAVENFKSGKIVIFPTDTAIGIGCRIDDEKAVEKLFRIRKRPKDKPLLALVSSLEMAKQYWREIPEDVNDLIKKYWPGSLTLVLHSNEVKVPKIVTGNTNTLGMRLPKDYKLQKLIEDVGVPILAPSANFHGEKTPFNLRDVNPELVKL